MRLQAQIVLFHDLSHRSQLTKTRLGLV